MLRAVASQILSGTWANKPSSAANGAFYFASDVGECGTLFQYSTVLTRWRAFNGRSTLDTLAAAVTGVTSSGNLPLQTLLPAGSWQVNDSLRFTLAMGKSGTTDSLIGNVYIGTAGTTGDTAVISANSWIASTSVTGGMVFDIKLVSATSAQRVGTGPASGVGSYSGHSATAAAAAVAITSASANALYVTVGVASSGATNTVSVQGGSIELVTP